MELVVPYEGIILLNGDKIKARIMQNSVTLNTSKSVKNK
jgi:hypothetical protein